LGGEGGEGGVGAPHVHVEQVTTRGGHDSPPEDLNYANQNIGEVNELSRLRLQYSDFLHNSNLRGGGKCPEEERST
jgi:hypothetical protein